MAGERAVGGGGGGRILDAGVVWGSRAEVGALRCCGAAALRRTALAVEGVVHLGAWHGEHL
jgi:hypothetical protein